MREIRCKTVLIILIFCLALSLVPLLKVAKYNVPSEDDYAYGMATHRVWEETGSLTAVLKTAFDRVIGTWHGWQGSFAAIYLFCLQPAVFGEQYYFLVPWIMLTALLSGIFFFTISLYHDFLGGSKTDAAIIAVILAVICTQFLPRPAQAFYWYNGSVYYAFFFGLSLIAYALLLRVTRYGGMGKMIAAGNLITGLTTAVLLVMGLAGAYLAKQPNRRLLWLPLICFAIGFALNVGAPGNAVRQAKFYPPTPTRALYLSFREIVVSMPRWCCLPVLALFAFSVPFFRHIAAESHFDFPLPGLVSLASFCLMAVMEYPPMYSMGHTYQVWRIINIVFFGCMTLILFNIYYWIGWLQRRKRLSVSGGHAVGTLYCAVIALIFLAGTAFFSGYDVTAVSATKSYLNGEMGNYYHTWKQRLEILKDPRIEDAVLKRYPVRPYVLWYRDFSEEADGNNLACEWYHKKSVIVK